MFPAKSLLTILLLALSIVATPVGVRTSRITLPVAKRINSSGGAINLVEHDQARAAAMKERGAAIQSGKLDGRADNIDITNEATSYVATVGIGNPPTSYNLIIDTGSSNTWVGAGKAYVVTGTSLQTPDSVSVTYSSGSFSGTEWLDTVTIVPSLTIRNQSIGVASQSVGVKGVDGILGIGPVDLTVGTLSPDSGSSIPTVTDNLFSQGVTSSDVFGIYFEPTTTTSSTNGELTFGDTDPLKYTGTISYTPLTTTSPASNFWGINESITYGSTTILAETAGIVDTGSTLILLASDAYSAYQAATGASPDSSVGLLTFTTAQYDALQDLNFNIGSVTYALTPNGQIWPRSLNTYIGGTTGAIYGIVNNIRTPSGQGLDFVNGQAFLERFYSVYDTSNARVGFATTPYTDATSN